jgi:hypothetical protein
MSKNVNNINESRRNIGDQEERIYIIFYIYIYIYIERERERELVLADKHWLGGVNYRLVVIVY